MSNSAGPALSLADTNVLLRVARQSQQTSLNVQRVLRFLEDSGIAFAFTLQNLTEFWNVSTRPVASNGFGLSIEECNISVQKLEPGFIFLTDNDAVRTEWRRLVVKHRVSGVQVHDARLAASMLAHGVTHILTFNTTDFARFDGIVAVNPASVEREFSIGPDILTT